MLVGNLLNDLDVQNEALKKEIDQEVLSLFSEFICFNYTRSPQFDPWIQYIDRKITDKDKADCLLRIISKNVADGTPSGFDHVYEILRRSHDKESDELLNALSNLDALKQFKIGKAPRSPFEQIIVDVARPAGTAFMIIGTCCTAFTFMSLISNSTKFLDYGALATLNYVIALSLFVKYTAVPLNLRTNPSSVCAMDVAEKSREIIENKKTQKNE